MSTLGPPPLRLLLVDAQVLVRAGIRMLLDNHPSFRVVGKAGEWSESLALAAREQPDVILLELDLCERSGLELLPELLIAARAARVLILTAVCDSVQHRHAVRLGAKGVVLKESSVEILIKAIEKVHAGEVWLDRTLIADMLHELTQNNGHTQPTAEEAKSATLTARECEVISLIGEGLRNAKMAQRLFISETTVRHHLTSIFSKLHLTDRLDLALYAYRHGLATLP
jgi:two-component system nitrate/nitrite response regulator NarL